LECATAGQPGNRRRDATHRAEQPVLGGRQSRTTQGRQGHLSFRRSPQGGGPSAPPPWLMGDMVGLTLACLCEMGGFRGTATGEV
jgi:hypothetical protein